VCICSTTSTELTRGHTRARALILSAHPAACIQHHRQTEALNCRKNMTKSIHGRGYVHGVELRWKLWSRCTPTPPREFQELKHFTALRQLPGGVQGLFGDHRGQDGRGGELRRGAGDELPDRIAKRLEVSLRQVLKRRSGQRSGSVAGQWIDGTDACQLQVQMMGSETIDGRPAYILKGTFVGWEVFI